MLPSEFLARLKKLAPEAAYEQIVFALSSERPTTLRVNTLKSDAPTVTTLLASRGIALEALPWNPDFFILKNSTLRALSETPEYKEGLLYVQSLSSMLPPLILNPKPGEKVLDMAAAPGSKTTQMAALMGNSGEIVANDTSRERIYRLKANLATQGVTNAKTAKEDGRSIWQQYPEYFDKTLVDVPCSMEGRFNSDDPKTYEDWSLKKVKDLSHLQRWMLRSAVSATKPGGTIVYSTCTLSPEENEEVVDWIMEKEKGHITLEEVEVPGLHFDPPILHWGTKNYDQHIGRTARVYPRTLMEGFYITKIRKLKSSLPKALAG